MKAMKSESDVNVTGVTFFGRNIKNDERYYWVYRHLLNKKKV